MLEISMTMWSLVQQAVYSDMKGLHSYLPKYNFVCWIFILDLQILYLIDNLYISFYHIPCQMNFQIQVKPGYKRLLWPDWVHGICDGSKRKLCCNSITEQIFGDGSCTIGLHWRTIGILFAWLPYVNISLVTLLCWLPTWRDMIYPTGGNLNYSLQALAIMVIIRVTCGCMLNNIKVPRRNMMINGAMCRRLAFNLLLPSYGDIDLG